MKKVSWVLAAITLTLLMASDVHAKNEFENGFKAELGAISARAAVGLGMGLVRGIIIYDEPYYEPYRRPYYGTYRVPVRVEHRACCPTYPQKRPNRHNSNRHRNRRLNPRY
jgi:hypothetical protein